MPLNVRDLLRSHEGEHYDLHHAQVNPPFTRVLTQVAVHQIDVIELIPPLAITASDVTWFLQRFEKVMTNPRGAGTGTVGSGH